MNTSLSSSSANPELIVVGHSAPINSLAFSPDGRTLVSGSYDRTTIIWDLESMTMRRLLTTHDEWGVQSVAFSPDGRFIASTDSSLYLWNADTGLPVRKFRGNGDPFAFSPDGRTIARIEYVWSDKVWQVSISNFLTGRIKKRIPCGDQYPDGIAFSADGQAVAVAANIDTESDASSYAVSSWDLNSGESHHHIWNEKVSLFMGDARIGARFLAVALDGSRLWNAETGDLIRTVHSGSGQGGSERAVALSPNVTMVAVGGLTGHINLWGSTTARDWQVKGHDGWVRALAFSPDGETLATTGDDCVVRLWDAATGQAKGSLGIRRVEVKAISFRSDGGDIAFFAEDGQVRSWSLNTLKMAAVNVATSNSAEADAPQAGEIRLYAENDRVLEKVNWQDQVELLQGLSYGLGRGREAVISPDGSRAVVAASGGAPVLWDCTTKQDIAPLEELYTAAYNWTHTAVFSPHSRILATSQRRNHPTRIWLSDAVTGGNLTVLDVPDSCEALYSLAFTFDGLRLASGHEGHAICLWNVSTGRLIRTLYANRDGVNALAFAPDGKTLAVGTAYDDTVWLRGLGRGGRKRSLKGHAADLRALTYSPNGKLLASAAQDSTVRFWDAASGLLLVTLRLLSPADWVAYTPEGYYDGSAGVERFLRLRVGNELLNPPAFTDEFRRSDEVRMALQVGEP